MTIDIEAGFFGIRYEDDAALPFDRIWYRSTRGVYWLVKGAALVAERLQMKAVLPMEVGAKASKIPWDLGMKHFGHLVPQLDRMIHTGPTHIEKLATDLSASQRAIVMALQLGSLPRWEAPLLDADINDLHDLVKIGVIRVIVEPPLSGETRVGLTEKGVELFPVFAAQAQQEAPSFKDAMGAMHFTLDGVGPSMLEMHSDGMFRIVRPPMMLVGDDIPDNVEGIDHNGEVRREGWKTSSMYAVRVRGSGDDWETVENIEARDARDAAERWAAKLPDENQVKGDRYVEVMPRLLIGRVKVFRVYTRPNWIHTASRLETSRTTIIKMKEDPKP